MVSSTFSSTTERNSKLKQFSRRPGEGNLAWGARAAKDVGRIDPKSWSCMVLLGSSDTLGFRLRVAQSHLRPDMLPSFWSEALLVEQRGLDLKDAMAIHVPLAQPIDAAAYPPYENGVVEEPFSAFDDPVRYPNIAIAALPIPLDRLRKRVDRFRKSRSALDSLEHVLRWLAFSWGVARTGNPLHDNFGLPSACMIEMVCAAEDYELTPGLESRASCPEAIWASLLYWHKYYATTGRKGVPLGRFTVDHRFDIHGPHEAKPDPTLPTKGLPKKGSQ